MSARGTDGARFSESTSATVRRRTRRPARCLAAVRAWELARDSALTLVADDDVTMGTSNGLQAPTSLDDGAMADTAVEGTEPESPGGCTLWTARSDGGAAVVGGLTGAWALIALLRRQ